MSRFVLFASFLVMGTLLTRSIYAQDEVDDKPHKPTLMVLATYHMNNPGRDAVNVKADDVLAPKRQREIEEEEG